MLIAQPQLIARAHASPRLCSQRSELLRENGPLLSIFLWFRCATTAFPMALFIGKADDDCWLHPSQWAVLLQNAVLLQSQATAGKTFDRSAFDLWDDSTASSRVKSRLARDAVGVPAVYVGSFEGYHWRTQTNAPVGWRNYPLGPNEVCKEHAAKGTEGPTRGPFPFARGAIFFLSRNAARIVEQTQEAHVAALTRDDTPRCFRGSQAWYEGRCCSPDGIRTSDKKHCSHHRLIGKRCGHELPLAVRKAMGRSEVALAAELQKQMAQLAASKAATNRTTAVSACVDDDAANPAWEDVWTGFVLGTSRQLRRRGSGLMLVDVRGHLFSDNPGFGAKRTLIAWHSKVDRDFPRRLAVLHRWMREHGCTAGPIVPSCGQTIPGVPRSRSWARLRSNPALNVTCAGARQLPCTAHDTRLTDAGRGSRMAATAKKCDDRRVLLWDDLPPLATVDGWSLAQLRGFARGELNVTLEGELKRRECAADPQKCPKKGPVIKRGRK